jgi:hypothetical protein
MTRRWFGIDFSGNADMWQAGRSASNVWLAEVGERADGLALVALSHIRDLARASAAPFEWLCDTLSEGRFAAAAIDAPFSAPARFVGPDGHAGLVSRIGRCAPPRGRPFLRGADFVKEVTGCDPPLSPPKPYRATEQRWREKKVETRSTLWVTPRGGAPMTAACIRLLHLADRPIWPWSDRNVGGTLVEGFPAAQLCQWGLPHETYNGCGRAATKTRRDIIAALRTRLSIPSDLEQHMLASADALDAVVCAFAAIAVTTGHVAHPPAPAPEAHLEGWIAVHR